MKILLVIGFLFYSSFRVDAQLQMRWAITIPGENPDFVIRSDNRISVNTTRGFYEYDSSGVLSNFNHDTLFHWLSFNLGDYSSLLVNGYSVDSLGDPVFKLKKYDSNNNEVLSTDLLLPNNLSLQSAKFIVGQNNHIFYSFNYRNTVTWEAGFFIEEYDSVLNRLWSRSITSNSQFATMRNLKFDKNNYPTICGSQNDASGGAGDMIWYRFDTLGNILQSAIYDSTNMQDRAFDMTYDNSNTAYLFGTFNTSGGAPSTKSAIVRVDSSSGFTWERDCNNTGLSFNHRIVIDSQQNLYGVVSDVDYFFTSGNHMEIFKYNLSGTLLWHLVYRQGQNINDVANDVVLDSNDNLFIAGQLSDSTGRNGCILKFDPSGNLIDQWLESSDTVTSFTKIILLDDSSLLACGIYQDSVGNKFTRLIKIGPQLSSGIENLSKEKFLIYPNPATTYFTLTNSDSQLLTTKSSVFIISSTGETVQTSQWSETSNNINIQNLYSGIYSVLIEEKGGIKNYIGKLVIN